MHVTYLVHVKIMVYVVLHNCIIVVYVVLHNCIIVVYVVMYYVLCQRSPPSAQPPPR